MGAWVWRGFAEGHPESGLDSFVLWGVKFTKNQPVEVDDPKLVAKLQALAEFEPAVAVKIETMDDDTPSMGVPAAKPKKKAKTTKRKTKLFSKG